MTRTALIVLLVAMLTTVSGCGANRETAQPTTGAEKQDATSQALPADKAKADAVETKPTGESSRLGKFGAIERIPERAKPDYYYVHSLPKIYLATKGHWVRTPDGYKNTVEYFDDDSTIFQCEKKFMEDCFIRGIEELRLVAYREFKPLEKGRVLSHGLTFISHEAKVFAEYSYEYIYADGRRETKTERKAFTLREDKEWGQAVGFANKITAVIVNIEDAVETDS